MPAWFSKLFKNGEDPSSSAKSEPTDRSSALMPGPAPQPAPRPAPRPLLFDDEEDMLSGPPRRVVDPTVLVDEEEQSAWSDEIRIKARVERDGRGCVFLVDRPVLEKFSAWFPDRMAASESPLAQAIFDVDAVDSVLIHGMTVSVGRVPISLEPWEPWARDIGGLIRGHLQSGAPILSQAFVDRIPSDEDIRARIERVIQTEINPGIAAHSGAIVLERVTGNTVYIRMMGGCQGCAASTITLRQGVHQAFRDAVPGLGAILDETDHGAGQNPYYRQLPAGME